MFGSDLGMGVVFRLEDAFSKTSQDIQRSMGQLGGISEKMSQGVTKSMEQIKVGFGLLSAGGAMLAGFVAGAAQFAKMDDSLSDVKKSTGLAGEELDKFKQTVFELDTRTGLFERMDIAKVGGQLGVANGELAGFVKTVDMAVVALGDEFSGGVEGVTNSLGVLKNLFTQTKDLKYDDAINRIGSAINELGAQGSATGQNIADFTSRLGGSMGFTIQQSLAMGAALQELGLNGEIGASGLKSILKAMNAEAPAFAKVLGISMKEYKRLYDTDLMGLVKKTTKLFTGKSNFDAGQLARSLKVNDQEAQRVLLALANDTSGILDKSLKTSIENFGTATSLSKEFRTKNENFPATMDKLKNSFLKFGLVLGEIVSPIISVVSKAFSKFSDWLTKLSSNPIGKFILQLVLGLGILFTVMGAGMIVVGGLRLGLLKLTTMFGQQTAAMIITTIAQKGVVAGFRQMAVAAWASLGPYILIAVAIGAFIGVLYVLYKAIDKGNYVLAGFAVALAFALGPIYGVIALIVGAFLMLRKAVKDFSTKSAEDLGKQGGIVGFLEKIGGLIVGIRAIFSSWNNESKTFELGVDLEKKLDKVGILQTVRNIGTWIARLSVIWDGFKETMIKAWEKFKEVLGKVVDWFKPLTTQFTKWDTLITANTDSMDRWKKYGEYAAYAIIGVLGVLTLSFVAVGVASLVAMLPLLTIIAAIGLAIYGVIKFINWMNTSTSGVAQTFKDIFGAIWDYLKFLLSAVWDLVKGLFNFIKGVIDAFRNLFKTGDFKTFLKDILKTVGAAIWEVLKVIGKFIWEILKVFGKVFLGLGKLFISFLKNLPSLLGDLFSFLGGIASKVFSLIGGLISDALSYIGKSLGDLWDSLMVWAGSKWSDFINWLFEGASGIFSSIWDSIKGFLGYIWDSIGSFFGSIWDWFKELPEKMVAIGGQIVDNIKAGVMDKWEKLVSWLTDKFKVISDFFSTDTEINGKISSSTSTNSTIDNKISYSDNLAKKEANKWIIPNPTVVTNTTTNERVMQPVFNLDGNTFAGVVIDRINDNLNR